MEDIQRLVYEAERNLGEGEGEVRLFRFGKRTRMKKRGV